MSLRLETPISPDAERNLIASTIIDPALIDEFELDRTVPEAFHSQRNRIIWTHILQLHWDAKPIDLPSVMESLRLAQQINDAGGAAYLVGLMSDAEGVGTSAGHYADTINETYKRRQLLNACTAVMQSTVDHGYSQASEEMEGHLQAIRGNERTGVNTAAAIAESFADGIEGARLSTGFRSIDRMIGGFPIGDLTVLAARTSMGKSALAHNIAFRVKNTHVLTPDQPLPEIMISETCRRARVPYHVLRDGKAKEEQKAAWRAEFQNVKNEMKTLVTFDDGHLSYHRLISEVRRAARQGRKLVIVDHVQHVRSSHHKDKRLLMVDITGSLKAIAREEGIAILALSQLSRELDFRKDKRPTLVDLSESKTLEEDANVVLFMYRPGYYDPQASDAHLTEIIVGKSKTSARLSFAQLLWQDTFMQFEDI